MSESDTETLYDEPISHSWTHSKKKILEHGRRGLEWKRKLLQGIASKVKIARLKARGWTKDEIADEEPGYFYDEEYHGLTSELGFRRNRSCSDLSSAVGTYAGYHAWEYCGGPCHSREV
jgi:hypothetical protein